MKLRKVLLGSASRAVTGDPDKGKPEERAKRGDRKCLRAARWHRHLVKGASLFLVSLMEGL